MLNKNGLLIVSALPVELRPWIDYFSASRLPESGPWPVYINADRSVVLLETGVGLQSAAAAVAHTMAALATPSAWSVLNIGIAGSGFFELGDWVLANEVVDVTTNSHFYLRPPVLKDVPRSLVRSDARPSDNYQLPALLDMEAAAVVAMAKRFVSQEQIGVLKLVSDTDSEQQQSLNKQQVTHLLQDCVEQVLPVLQYYREYSVKQVHDLPELPQALLQRLHFSVSHQQQLKRLWRSYRVFFPELDLVQEARGCQSAKEVIAFLNEKLQSVEFHWSDA